IVAASDKKCRSNKWRKLSQAGHPDRIAHVGPPDIPPAAPRTGKVLGERGSSILARPSAAKRSASSSLAQANRRGLGTLAHLRLVSASLRLALPLPTSSVLAMGVFLCGETKRKRKDR